MLHYITVYYMFRLSKISHHQVLPDFTGVGGHEISFLKVKDKYMRESLTLALI